MALALNPVCLSESVSVPLISCHSRGDVKCIGSHSTEFVRNVCLPFNQPSLDLSSTGISIHHSHKTFIYARIVPLSVDPHSTDPSNDEQKSTVSLS
jgi:hypothetical protein